MNALNGSLSLSLPPLFPDGWLCSFSIVVDKGGRPPSVPPTSPSVCHCPPAPSRARSSVRREGASSGDMSDSVPRLS